MKKIYNFIMTRPIIFLLFAIIILFIPSVISAEPQGFSKLIIRYMAIDKIEDEFEVTVCAYIPRAINKFSENNQIISAKGSSVNRAILNIAKLAGKTVGLAHSNLVLVNDELCEYGLISALDYLVREYSLGNNTFVMGTGDIPAKEVINVANDLAKDKGISILDIIEYDHSHVYSKDLWIEELYNETFSPNKTSINLENIYQRSFYDLVDNVSNTEVKLGKLLSSSDAEYNKKLLAEIHENANNAQGNLSYLPISINGIPDTIKFINQLDGYTKTLVKNGKLNPEDYKVLGELHVSVTDIKLKLDEMSQKIIKGYNISLNSKDMKSDFTEFTKLIQVTKTKDVDYPTMIYDGPFADTVLNREIKGLNLEEISEKDAQQKASSLFENSKISLAGESKGKFNTYDYNISLSNGVKCYAQLTKRGGKLLTLSSYADSSKINYSKEQAIKIAEDFAKTQGIDAECVWSDVVEKDAYINLAPVINDVIYYPDLVKVKVDLSSGMVLGWEASTYYTNHRERGLPEILYPVSKAKSNIDSSYNIETIKLSLSPMEDSNQEIFTHEIKCTKEGSIYYFYIDVQTGKTVNILKVVETDNGNLLM